MEKKHHGSACSFRYIHSHNLYWKRYKTAQTATYHPLTPVHNSHYTCISSDSPCRFGDWIWPCSLIGWKEGLKSKVIGVSDLLDKIATRQLRQPSTTLWHPHKTHTTPESVLVLPAGMGLNLTLMAWLDRRKGSWHPKIVLVWVTCWKRHMTAQTSDSHPPPSGTLTRLTLHLNQFWLSLQVWDWIWPWWPDWIGWHPKLLVWVPCWSTRQLRHPPTTLWLPYKTHTTPQSKIDGIMTNDD